MKELAFAILIAGGLVACTANPNNIRSATSAQRHIVDKNYSIGAEQVAHVGQAVIRVKDYFGSPVPTFASQGAFSASLGGASVEYPAGTQVKATLLVDHEGATYSAAAPTPSLPGGALLMIDQQGRYAGLAYTHQDEVFEACDDREYVCVTPKEISFTKAQSEDVVETPGFANFEIIYSGSTKDAINLLYREYTPKDMARPAFTQNLTYDRGSSHIRFRDVKIRVVEAGNESLRYAVESDGLD